MGVDIEKGGIVYTANLNACVTGIIFDKCCTNSTFECMVTNNCFFFITPSLTKSDENSTTSPWSFPA